MARADGAPPERGPRGEGRREPRTWLPRARQVGPCSKPPATGSRQFRRSLPPSGLGRPTAPEVMGPRDDDTAAWGYSPPGAGPHRREPDGGPGTTVQVPHSVAQLRSPRRVRVARVGQGRPALARRRVAGEDSF